MEGSQDSPIETHASLAELDSSIFENANTITKWLLSQAEDAQPR
jgi:hypothetical protein